MRKVAIILLVLALGTPLGCKERARLTDEHVQALRNEIYRLRALQVRGEKAHSGISHEKLEQRCIVEVCPGRGDEYEGCLKDLDNLCSISFVEVQKWCEDFGLPRRQHDPKSK